MFSLIDGYEKGSGSTLMTIVMGVVSSLLFTTGLFLILNTHNNSQQRQLQSTIDAIKKSLAKSGNSSSAALLNLESALASKDSTKAAATPAATAPTNSFDTITVKNTSNLQGDVKASKGVTVGGKLAIKSDATIGGNFDITGTADVQTTLNVGGDTTIGSTLTAQGTSTLTGALAANGAATFSTLNVGGDTSLATTLNVQGSASLKGNFDVAGAATIKTLNATGSTTVDGGALASSTPTVTVQSAATINDLTITGAATLGTTLNATGSTTVDGSSLLAGATTLAVTGATTLDGHLLAVGTDALAVTGATTLSSTLGVQGSTNLTGNLGVTGATTLDGHLLAVGTDALAVTGATTLSSTLNVTGSTTTADLHVTGATTFAGTLNTTGSTNPIALTGGLTVNGAAITGDLTVTGSTAFNNGLTVNGAATTGNVTVNGMTTVSAGATLDTTNSTNPIALTGGLTVNGTASTGDLTVTGATTFNNGLTVNGAATTGNVTVNGMTTVSSTGTLDATAGSTILNNGVSVSGTASFGQMTINASSSSATALTIGTGSLYIQSGIVQAGSGFWGITVSESGHQRIVPAGSGETVGQATGDHCSDGSYFNVYGVSSGIITDGQCELAANTPGGNDVAEKYPSTQSLTPGEVVSIDVVNSQYVVKSTVPNDNMAIGIVSTTPGYTLGINNPGYPIALAGRVPVDVTNEGGPIAPGDYLTSSSTPGFAMKATPGDKTIGQALEAFNGTRGQIIMFVNVAPGNQSQQLQTAQTPSQTNGNFASLNVSGPSTLSDLKVTGAATVNNLTVTGLATVATITINGHIVGNDDTRGTVTIPKGQQTLHHSFAAAFTKKPVLVASPEGQAVLYSLTPTNTGFDINLLTPATTDTTFDYLVQE